MLDKSKKSLFVSGVLLGLIGIALALTGNPKNMAICIACFIRDTAGALKFHNAEVVQYVRPEITGIVLGAFLVSLFSKEFKSVGGSSPMLRFLLGIFMMVGALAFLGCPLRMVIRMAAGDLNAWVALPGFAAGVGTGSFALKKGFSLGRSHDIPKSNGYVLPVILTVILILSVTTTLFVVSQKGPGSQHSPVLIALGAGLVFGILSQRVRTCFAGSLRDVFMLRNFDLLSIIGGLFVAMLIFNIATGNFNLSFDKQPVAHSSHLWNILGMYAVGLAAVLLGGCPLRQLVLAGQGSSDAGITWAGMFLGSALCHNFKLAGIAGAEGGLTMNGKVAVVTVIVVLIVIAFSVKKKN